MNGKARRALTIAVFGSGLVLLAAGAFVLTTSDAFWERLDLYRLERALARRDDAAFREPAERLLARESLRALPLFLERLRWDLEELERQERGLQYDLWLDLWGRLSRGDSGPARSEIAASVRGCAQDIETRLWAVELVELLGPRAKTSGALLVEELGRDGLRAAGYASLVLICLLFAEPDVDLASDIAAGLGGEEELGFPLFPLSCRLFESMGPGAVAPLARVARSYFELDTTFLFDLSFLDETLLRMDPAAGSAAKALAAHLKGADAATREAIRGLLWKQLRSSDELEAATMFNQVMRIDQGPASIREPLAMLLGKLDAGDESNDEDDLVWILELLREVDFDTALALSPVSTCLQHARAEVRGAAASLLGTFQRQSEGARGALGMVRGDPLPAVREAAAAALIRLAGRSPPRSRLAIDDEALWAAAGDAGFQLEGEELSLGTILADVGSDDVLVWLRDESRIIRYAAADVLADRGVFPPEAIGVHIEMLEDLEHPHRFHAAWALGRAGPAAWAAIPRLEKALGDPQHRVRSAAAAALRRLRAAAEGEEN